MSVFSDKIRSVIVLLIAFQVMPFSTLAFGCGCNNTKNNCGNVAQPTKKVEEQLLYCQGIVQKIPTGEQKVKFEQNQIVQRSCCGSCLQKTLTNKEK